LQPPEAVAAWNDIACIRIFCYIILKIALLIIGQDFQHSLSEDWGLYNERKALYAIGV
jgi:hypothetical protein